MSPRDHTSISSPGFSVFLIELLSWSIIRLWYVIIYLSCYFHLHDWLSWLAENYVFQPIVLTRQTSLSSTNSSTFANGFEFLLNPVCFWLFEVERERTESTAAARFLRICKCDKVSIIIRLNTSFLLLLFLFNI